MKKLLLLIAVLSAVMAHAQDVIVKRDGSTIISKVLEVNQADIKYKKFSNQQGPTYTINKSDVMAINYESGDKDTFEDAAQPIDNTTLPSNTSTPFGINPNLAEDNLRLVREFNSHDLIYLGNDTTKKSNTYAKVLGIKEGSIIETPELKVRFAMKVWHGKVSTFVGNYRGVTEETFVSIGENKPYAASVYQYKIAAILENKTDRTIFVDLAKSYIFKNDLAIPYYVPTATSTTQGGTSGGSVNLGAVAGVLGVGGSLGTLANGVNVGNSNTTVNTKTTYSQRILAIPPMSMLSLEPQEIGQGMKWKSFNSPVRIRDIEKAYVPYFKDNQVKLKRGEKTNVPPLSGISPLGIFITYSFNESINSTQSMRIDFYLRQIMGTKDSTGRMLDYSKCPLIFF